MLLFFAFGQFKMLYIHIYLHKLSYGVSEGTAPSLLQCNLVVNKITIRSRTTKEIKVKQKYTNSRSVLKWYSLLPGPTCSITELLCKTFGCSSRQICCIFSLLFSLNSLFDRWIYTINSCLYSPSLFYGTVHTPTGEVK